MGQRGLFVQIGLCVLAFCCAGAWGQDQELVFHTVASEKLEATLKDLDIAFQKKPGKKEGIFTYDFVRKDIKIRLYNYEGEDLWIETDVTEKVTLEQVNAWNMCAKFSRAVLVQGDTNTTISLENQVDCTIGMTDGMLRQFIQRFESEAQSFSKFLKK